MDSTVTINANDMKIEVKLVSNNSVDVALLKLVDGAAPTWRLDEKNDLTCEMRLTKD